MHVHYPKKNVLVNILLYRAILVHRYHVYVVSKSGKVTPLREKVELLHLRTNQYSCFIGRCHGIPVHKIFKSAHRKAEPSKKTLRIRK